MTAPAHSLRRLRCLLGERRDPAPSRRAAPLHPDDPSRPFWERKTLRQMTEAEWESLCDGCGKCCLNKLQDEDTGALAFTNAACKLLDRQSCRCSDYANRWDFVPDCVKLGPSSVGRLAWLPSTCAYRLLDEGQPLPSWHPLLTGDPESVHRAGISVRGRVVCETSVDDLEDHVVDWEDL
ncbi:YcgN family cysteine cluster protein [Roseospira navarrensis]|uniref:UPF0260 protein GHC57_10850 n=1 Tax=Roseospira navarrensis TaxID=140058 RepID=A0A7X1ZEI2_9PROT|nr:YcgN family cysteine cluster protein [Roseospira navarrensis]MQX37016.1 YcgN family cysteine cluster protein [Roseospira navarrensis]